jgi:hypothetical protein
MFGHKKKAIASNFLLMLYFRGVDFISHQLKALQCKIILLTTGTCTLKLFAVVINAVQ